MEFMDKYIKSEKNGIYYVTSYLLKAKFGFLICCLKKVTQEEDCIS